MPLDAYKNFAIGTLSTGINSSATSATLTTGHGARMPAVPYNAVIYNSTDYADAAAAYVAGAAEVVRVTAQSTDTLSTIVRAQESTSAVNLNTGGKTYTIVAGLTAKFASDLPSYDMLSTLTGAEISVTTTTTLTISRMHVCSGTSADYTVTLPAASGNGGKFIGVRMSPGLTKFVTLDGNGSETIDLALNRVMWAGEVAILFCDGANWFKVAGKTIPMSAALTLPGSGAVQTISTATMTKIINSTATNPTGAMTDTGNYEITIRRSGIYDLFAIVVWDALPGNVVRMLNRIFKNTSTELVGSEVNGVTGGYPSYDCRKIVPLVAGDILHQSCYQNYGSNLSVFGTDIGGIFVMEIPTW